MRFLPLLLTLLIASPAHPKDKYPITHWIQKDHFKFCHKCLSFEEAKTTTKDIQRWCKPHQKWSKRKKCFVKTHQLDVEWITAKYTVENHFSSSATDGKESYGKPQLQVNTAQEQIDRQGAAFKVTPETLKRFDGLAIKIACEYFDDLLTYYHGDYIKATRAYNAGLGNVDRGRFKNGPQCLPGAKYFADVYEQYVLLKTYEIGH